MKIDESVAAPRSARKPLEWSGEDLRGRGLALEWLETDGLGGYACGTASGPRTRRYHGWYVPAIPPPRRRWMMVSGAEEIATVRGANRSASLSTQVYRDTTHGDGASILSRFRLEPFPTWVYESGDIAIERSLCIVRDRSMTVVRWTNRGAAEVHLRVRPLLAFRGAHRLQKESGDWDATTEVRGETSWVKPLPYLPRLFLRGVFGTTHVDAAWYRNFRYAEEAARGYDSEEDLWSPLEWEWNLRPDAQAFALFSLEEAAGDPDHLFEEERGRRREFAATSDPVFDELASRAETFVAADHRRTTILAGFPWLGDWGRQAMVAAPGLALAHGRVGAVAPVLNAFGSQQRDGVILGHFSGEVGEPEYDSIDTSLWFVLAVEWFSRARRNPGRPSPLLDAVRAVVQAYRRGTRLSIGAGADGLLSGDSPGRALTWMDAVVDGQPVTPRGGRAVEVNALWHAALKSAARLERLAGETGRARELESQAWHVARRFNEVFWCAEKGYLYDVVGEAGADASLRPNQILAVALTEDLLPPHRARSVYWAVRRSLLTPFGLRTLAPDDPRYRGRCAGDERARLSAVHQGAVHPWLMGPFADAHFRVFGNTEESRKTMRAMLAPLRAHVRDAGLGFISEMFDGDPPHAPRGCFAQAWSVAEVARVLYTHLRGGE